MDVWIQGAVGPVEGCSAEHHSIPMNMDTHKHNEGYLSDWQDGDFYILEECFKQKQHNQLKCAHQHNLTFK